MVAAAAAMLVTMKALAARPLAATAEPALKPNQPNHRRPAPRTVIGTSCGSIRSPLATRRPMQQRDDEGGDARADVDDGAAGEVERAELEQPAVDRPDPVGERGVDEDRPQDREQDEGAEALALGEGAGDQRRRDRREHQLERREQHERDRRGVDRRRLETDAVEHREVEAADEPEPADVRPEREGEADDHPHDADEGQPEEAVHDRRQHVLAADEAAVEQREAGSMTITSAVDISSQAVSPVSILRSFLPMRDPDAEGTCADRLDEKARERPGRGRPRGRTEQGVAWVARKPFGRSTVAGRVRSSVDDDGNHSLRGGDPGPSMTCELARTGSNLPAWHGDRPRATRRGARGGLPPLPGGRGRCRAGGTPHRALAERGRTAAPTARRALLGIAPMPGSTSTACSTVKAS